jgi:hypothetical protein
MLHFCLNLIQPLTFSLFTCECGHRLYAFGTHLVCYSFEGQQIITHDTIQNVMYVVILDNGHVVWKEWWYTFTSRISLQVDLYMTKEVQVFVVDVVVTN